MRRREFITLLSSVRLRRARSRLTACRRIGVLMSTAVDDPQDQTRHTVFAQGLQELGWTIGRNVRIDYRWVPAVPIMRANTRRN
jgi:putative ABC transport system substrate-binding protein